MRGITIRYSLLAIRPGRKVTPMQIKTTRAAILARSREPLVVDEIALPEALDAGQVLVKVLHTTICGAQINEIDAVKGPDKFLPHLLGHEASAQVIEIGLGVTTVKPGDTVAIVVGSSSQAAHRLVGSVAVSLARRSPVPVVIVP